MKTERLYYADCYVREFDARIIGTRAHPEGGQAFVYLDRTAFYPSSGGQPSDRGTLGGVEVLDVIDEGEAIAHLVDSVPASEAVNGAIDWGRRFDHMQQHTGQHVLSAAFERTANLKTVSFHLGSDVSTIDLDSDRVGARQVEQAERLANEVIFENRAVEILFRSADEARQMNMRKPSGREDEVRLIRIENFDLSACGGTHVSRTGSIGLVELRKIERMKNLTRVEFVCGRRAARCAHGDLQIVSETALLLSSAPEKIPELVRKQSEEIRAGLKRNQQLTRSLAEYQAKELWAAAPEANGRRVIRRVFNSDESAQAKLLGAAAAELGSCVAVIGVKGKPGVIYLAQSKDGSSDLAAILKKVLAEVGGKGGGTRDFAQGGGIDEDQLENALTHAENLLRQQSGPT